MSRGRFEIWDWVITVAVTGALVVAGLSSRHLPTGLDPLGYALLVLGGISLAARRRLPVVVLVSWRRRRSRTPMLDSSR